MSCMIKISGADLDIDKLLVNTTLIVDKSYHRGEQRQKINPKKLNKESGASFIVSLAYFDEFEAQKNGARIFLSDNREAIRKIMAWPGVDGACLDFGIKKRDVAVQVDCLDSELLKLAGDLGIGIELSQYRCEDRKN
jgi:hypothetical protein